MKKKIIKWIWDDPDAEDDNDNKMFQSIYYKHVEVLKEEHGQNEYKNVNMSRKMNTVLKI